MQAVLHLICRIGLPRFMLDWLYIKSDLYIVSSELIKASILTRRLNKERTKC